MGLEEHKRAFIPSTAALVKGGDLIVEKTVEPTSEILSYAATYHFTFVNTMHMYLRIPINLFELYAQEHNRKLTVVNFQLPSSLLTEDVAIPQGFTPPAPGWSRYLHGIPHNEWQEFREWLVGAKWMAANKHGNKILYGCDQEDVLIRDPVKLQTMQIVGVKEFINVSFFLPSNQSGRLYLNTKNGPPFHCIYVAKNGPSAGEALTIFQKIREAT